VLSGFTEFETALRTVPMAHHFLVKPCDSEVLVDVIDRACHLQKLMRDERLRALAEPLVGSVTLPQAYLDLIRVLAEDEAGLEQIAAVAGADQQVAARIMQLVNSAFLGLGREIPTLELATAYLGTNMLKNLVLAVQVFGGDGTAAHDLWMHRAQRHALLVGTIARRIAVADKRLSEDAFIAGILHDIGKRMLMGGHAQRWSAMVERARAEQRPLHEIERQELGVTHAEVGAYLLARWGLPYPVIEAVANHHDPSRIQRRPGLDAMAAVHVADLLAHEQTLAASGEDDPFAPLDESGLRSLGLADRRSEWRELAARCLGAARSAEWLGDDGRRAA
jgi:putative nucleotidyltransferase with HDIG domain